MNQLSINKTNNIQSKLDKVKTLLQNTSVKIMEKLMKNKKQKQNDNIDFIMQQFYILHLCQYQIYDTMQENAEGYYIEYVQSLFKTQQLLFKLRITDDNNNNTQKSNFKLNKQTTNENNDINDLKYKDNSLNQNESLQQLVNQNQSNLQYKIVELKSQQKTVRKAIIQQNTDNPLIIQTRNNKENTNTQIKKNRKLNKKSSTQNLNIKRFMKKKSSSIANRDINFLQVFEEEKIQARANFLQQQYLEQGCNTEILSQEKNPLVLLAINKLIAEDILQEQQKMDTEIQQWINTNSKENTVQNQDKNVQKILKDTQQNLRQKDKIVEQIVIEQEQDQQKQKNVLISKEKFNLDIENILKDRYIEIYQKIMALYEKNNINNNICKEVQTDLTNEKFDRDMRRHKLQIQNLQLELQSMQKKNKEQINQKNDLELQIEKKKQIIQEISEKEVQQNKEIENLILLNQKLEKEKKDIEEQNFSNIKQKIEKQNNIDEIKRANQKTIKKIRQVLQKGGGDKSSLILESRSQLDQDIIVNLNDNISQSQNQGTFSYNSQQQLKDKINFHQLTQNIEDSQQSNLLQDSINSFDTFKIQKNKLSCNQQEEQEMQDYCQVEKLKQIIQQLIDLSEQLRTENSCYKELYDRNKSIIQSQRSSLQVNDAKRSSRVSRKSRKQKIIDQKIENYRASFLQKLLTTNLDQINEENQHNDSNDVTIKEQETTKLNKTDNKKIEYPVNKEKKKKQVYKRDSVRLDQKQNIKATKRKQSRQIEIQQIKEVKDSTQKQKQKRLSIQIKNKTPRKSISTQKFQKKKKDVQIKQDKQIQSSSRKSTKRSQFYNMQKNQQKLIQSSQTHSSQIQDKIDSNKQNNQENSTVIDSPKITTKNQNIIENNEIIGQLKQNQDEYSNQTEKQDAKLQSDINIQISQYTQEKIQQNKFDIQDQYMQKLQKQYDQDDIKKDSKEKVNIFKKLFNKKQQDILNINKTKKHNNNKISNFNYQFVLYFKPSKKTKLLQLLEPFKIIISKKSKQIDKSTQKSSMIRNKENFCIFINYKQRKLNKRCQTEKIEKKQLTKNLPKLEIQCQSFRVSNENNKEFDSITKNIKSLSVRNRQRSREFQQDLIIQTNKYLSSEKKVIQRRKQNIYQKNQKDYNSLQQGLEQNDTTDYKTKYKNIQKRFRFKGNTLIKINEKIKENKTRIQREYLKGLEKLIVKNTKYETLEDYMVYKNQKKKIITGSIMQNKNQKQIFLRKKLLYTIEQDLQKYSQILSFEETKQRLYTLIDAFFEVHQDICREECNHYKNFQDKLKSVMKMIHEEDIPKIRIQSKKINNQNI